MRGHNANIIIILPLPAPVQLPIYPQLSPELNVTMPRNTVFLPFTLILLLCILSPCTQATPVAAMPNEQNRPSIFSETKDYPLPNQGNVRVHDPNIIEHGDNFYLLMGGVHIPILKASSLDGPWENIGTVMDGPSIIEKKNRTRPWAPTTIERDGRFYCYYTVSKHGVRNSAIGVAWTDNLDSDGSTGSWTDEGALINTGTGNLSHVYPYSESNAIDASYITDQKTGQPYLLYGSFWGGIFQVPLADDLLSVANAEHPDSAHLIHMPDHKVKPQEGSFMSYHEPYYYLWFSHGKCCGFPKKGFPDKGQEYVLPFLLSHSVMDLTPLQI